MHLAPHAAHELHHLLQSASSHVEICSGFEEERAGVARGAEAGWAIKVI